jgi:HEAT repeat protein
LLLLACTRASDRGLEEDVERLAREGSLPESVVARVAARGARAVPEIEAALHAASVAGRLNLIVALGRAGACEAVPLLLHRAEHDDDERVRLAAEHALRAWAAGTGLCAKASRGAVRKLERAQKEGGPA